jgi:hypothetical protein
MLHVPCFSSFAAEQGGEGTPEGHQEEAEKSAIEAQEEGEQGFEERPCSRRCFCGSCRCCS